MEKLLSVESVATIVDSEGLGYSIQDYLSSEEIEDKILAEKWEKCSQLMNEIKNYIESKMPNDFQWGNF